MTRVSRSSSQAEYSVAVFIGRHVQTDADVDGMIDLADEVLLHIRAHDWANAESWPEGRERGNQQVWSIALARRRPNPGRRFTRVNRGTFKP